MADICIIYARPSKAIVKSLHEILSRRYSVWWDEHIYSGDYQAEIEHQLAQAKCVIPVWCRASRNNQNVVDEAEYAKEHGVPLLPIRIEQTEPPLGFGGFQTVDLIDWNGDHTSPGIHELLGRIAHTVTARPRALMFGDKQVEVPTFFRSISSHETAVQPVAAIQALKLLTPDAVLVSAYDVVKENDQKQRTEIISGIESCRSAGAVVLLDSGNYESSRKGDITWTSDHLHEALEITPHDVAFCFDDLNPPADTEGVCRRVIESVERNARQTRMPVLPIVHAPRDANGNVIFSLIPETLKQLCLELRPAVVAIPERELGEGILAPREHGTFYPEGSEFTGFLPTFTLTRDWKSINHRHTQRGGRRRI